MLGLSRDRIHGDDAAHGGTFALAIHIHRRLDEGIQQTVVAVVSQSFEAPTAAPFQIHTGERFLGEFLHLAATFLVAVALVAAALGHDPVDQVARFGVMDRHLGTVFIGDGKDGVATVEALDGQAQDRLGIHPEGISGHRLISTITIWGERGRIQS